MYTSSERMKNYDTVLMATKWGENWRKNFEKKMKRMGVVACGATSAAFMNGCDRNGN